MKTLMKTLEYKDKKMEEMQLLFKSELDKIHSHISSSQGSNMQNSMSDTSNI